MKSSDTVIIMKCPNCSGPMYPHTSENAFECFYCGHKRKFSPLDLTAFAEKMRFRHQKTEVEEGLLKLPHTAFMQYWNFDEAEYTVNLYKGGFRSKVKDKYINYNANNVRWIPIDEYLENLDEETYKLITERGILYFKCPNCANEVEGFENENIFLCKYCNYSYPREEVVKFGYYNKAYIFGPKFLGMPYWYLPFEIEEGYAKHLARKILSRNSINDFPIEFLFEKGYLKKYFFPYELSDFRIRSEIESNKGRFQVYQEWINWGVPKNLALDVLLCDRIFSWDFSKMEPFSPAYIIGDIVILGHINGVDNIGYLNTITNYRVTERIKQTFDLKRVKIVKQSRDWRRNHSYSMIFVPIYYLECQLPKEDKLLRIAINGQTGSCSAVVKQRENGVFSLFDSGENVKSFDLLRRTEMSDECTIYSKPVKIEYLKPKFLYKILK